MNVNKEKRDFTTGNPGKQLILFSLPLIATMFLQSLYNLADTVIIGRYVGTDGMAAVGTCGNVTNVMLMLITGATAGTSVIASQFLGARDEVRVRRTIYNALYIIVSLAILFGAIGIIFSRQLLQLVQVKEEILGDAMVYLRIIFAGTIATALYNTANNLSRALGDAVTPMIVLVISALLNVVLNLVFVINFGLGVAGVGYATVIATIISAVVCWIVLLRKMPVARPDKDAVKIDKDICRLIAQKGLPAALQQSGQALGGLICMGLVNTFPVIVTSAYTAATKVESLISYPPGGLTQGMQVFTGQNVGAGKFDRVKKGYRSAMRIIFGYSIFTLILFVFAGKPILGIFVSSGDANRAELIQIGYQYLMAVAAGGIGLLMNGVMFLTRYTLSGAGDASSATLLSVVEVAVRVISAYILSQHTSLGYIGVFLGAPISFAVGGTIGYVLYRKGDWKKKRIVKDTDQSVAAAASAGR